ncbi:hypothetical protein [Prevotella denticola]|uniref:hypothetical protein n=1 Tax=Prevotella denticola TaxID=28129 RepID=UPI0021511725|nr:hypothetical protein [Prevotella denticola]
MAINHYSNEKPRTFPVEGLSLMESSEAKGGVSGMEASRTGCLTMVQDADAKLLLWMDNRMGQRA